MPNHSKTMRSIVATPGVRDKHKIRCEKLRTEGNGSRGSSDKEEKVEQENDDENQPVS
jgi:hypothetical protein